MGSHPVNLAVRFLLEIAALVAIGFWGWSLSDEWPRILAAIGLPVIAAAIWGTFAVPGDPSRSGRAPVPTPGPLRLAIELAFFAFAVWALFEIDQAALGWILAVATLVHYVVSWDRIVWLFGRGSA